MPDSDIIVVLGWTALGPILNLHQILLFTGHSFACTFWLKTDRCINYLGNLCLIPMHMVTLQLICKNNRRAFILGRYKCYTVTTINFKGTASHRSSSDKIIHYARCVSVLKAIILYTSTCTTHQSEPLKLGRSKSSKSLSQGLHTCKYDKLNEIRTSTSTLSYTLSHVKRLKYGFMFLK